MKLTAVLVAATISAMALLMFCSDTGSDQHIEMQKSVVKSLTPDHSSRRLLQNESVVMIRPERIGRACSGDDIRVSQGATRPRPNHVPTYTVHITNACVSRCGMANVHLRCGWFSSTILINPRIFRRLRHNDCLVNDGKTIPYGATVSFRYANSFAYRPMDISSFSCTRAS